MLLFRELGDQWALAHPLCDLALRTWDEGRLHEAVALIWEYLAIFRQLRSLGGVPMALNYLSFMAAGIGDFATAAQAAQEKAEIEASRGLPIDRAYGLHSLAYVQLVQGNLAQARALCTEALAHAQEGSDDAFVAETLYHLGLVALYEERLDEAAGRLNESRRLGGGAERPWLEERTIFALGQVAARRGEYAAALALMQESLAHLQEVRPQIPARLEGLAQVWLGLDRVERAVTLLGATHRLREEMGCPLFPVEQPGHTQTLASLRARLDGAAFAEAWDAGRAMSAEQAIACALGDGAPVRPEENV